MIDLCESEIVVTVESLADQKGGTRNSKIAVTMDSPVSVSSLEEEQSREWNFGN